MMQANHDVADFLCHVPGTLLCVMGHNGDLSGTTATSDGARNACMQFTHAKAVFSGANDLPRKNPSRPRWWSVHVNANRCELAFSGIVSPN